MPTPPNYTLRHATEADVEAIVSLVNRAFAVERFFKTGDRTDVTIRFTNSCSTARFFC